MAVLHIFYAILVSALWGSNFVAAKIGMQHFPPFMYMGLRFIIVAALLVPLVPRPDVRQLKQIAAVAVVLGVLHFSLLFVAVDLGLEIGTGAILTQLGVPFSCLLGAIFFGDRIGPWRSFGLLLAFAGMTLVVGAPNVGAHVLPAWIAVAGAFFWAVSNIQLKRLPDISIFQMLGWMALFSMPLQFAISFAVEHDQLARVLYPPLSAVIAVLYTAFGSTIAGYGLWYFLIRRYEVSLVAPWSLTAPLFSIVLGHLVFDEALTWPMLLGGALTLAGVAVIVMRRPKLLDFGKPS